MPVGDRIRAARGYADLSQTELADQLGVDKQFIARREDGRQNPKRQELIAIAAICDVPLEYLEHGWNRAVAQSAGDEQRLEAIEQQISQLLELVNQRLGRDLRDSMEEALAALEQARAQDADRPGKPQRRNESE